MGCRVRGAELGEAWMGSEEPVGSRTVGGWKGSPEVKRTGPFPRPTTERSEDKQLMTLCLYY